MVTEKLSLLSMVLVSAAFGLAAVANAETEMRVETLRGCTDVQNDRIQSLCSAVIGNAHTKPIIDDEICVPDCETHPNAEPHIIGNYGRFTHSSALPDALFLFWTISAEQVEQFKEALSNLDIETLVLANNGGLSDPAIEIAKIVQKRGIATYIPKAFECNSACSLIWYAGDYRYARGQLGVHQFRSNISNQNPAALVESETQKRAAAYLNLYEQLDVPNWAIVQAFANYELYTFDDTELGRLSSQDYVLSAEYLEKIDEMAIILADHERARQQM